MVAVTYSPEFAKQFKKLNHASNKLKIIKLIEKLKVNPLLGKPMKFDRKGTRELYLSPFRLSYRYIEDELHIYVLELYHKDEQ